MPTYGMGDSIREMRIRMGYTQEELAYGICSIGTLSRIENGKTIVSKKVLEGLCDRLPGLHQICISYDTDKEIQRSKLHRQVLFYLEHRKATEVKASIEAYRQLCEQGNPLCRQIELYMSALYQAMFEKKPKKVLEKLKQALEITMPDYKKRLCFRKKAVLLTYGEVCIIAGMGITYAKQGELETAYHIFYNLRIYVESKGIDIAEATKMYFMVYGNLAWILERQRRFDEAIKQCEFCINLCCFSGNYLILPYLLCMKARCLDASSNRKKVKKCKQQAKTLLDIEKEYRGHENFEEFYKAKDPIYVVY